MTNEELVIAIRTEEDKEVRDGYLMQLYDQNRGILKIIYRGHFKSRMCWDDFAQESFVALTKAVDSFDASKTMFTTWYSRYVVWHIGRYWQATGTAIRLPVHVWNSLLMTAEAERIPTLNLVFQASLDEPINDESDSATRLDSVSDPHDLIGDIIDKTDADALKELLAVAINELPKRSADIVTRRFYDCQTLEEIANDYGLSRERVRQIEAQAIEILKRGRYRRRLKAFLSA